MRTMTQTQIILVNEYVDWPFFEQFFSKRLMQPEDSLYLLNPGTMSD